MASARRGYIAPTKSPSTVKILFVKTNPDGPVSVLQAEQAILIYFSITVHLSGILMRSGARTAPIRRCALEIVVVDE